MSAPREVPGSRPVRAGVPAPRLRSLAPLLGLLALAGCGGGGGHHSTGITSLLSCGGAVAPAVDEVALGCPASAAGSMTLTVLIGGPTTSSNIYSIDFDLVFNPAVLRYEGASAVGSFLAQGGATVILEAGPASNDPGRVVVSVSRQGSVPGVQGASASQTVVTLIFSGMAAGTTSLAFENGIARDSANATITSITFGAPVSVTFSQ